MFMLLMVVVLAEGWAEGVVEEGSPRLWVFHWVIGMSVLLVLVVFSWMGSTMGVNLPSSRLDTFRSNYISIPFL